MSRDDDICAEPRCRKRRDRAIHGPMGHAFVEPVAPLPSSGDDEGVPARYLECDCGGHCREAYAAGRAAAFRECRDIAARAGGTTK